MALTAGVLSVVSVGTQSVSISSTDATSGTGPYTYQLYKSTTSGFSPGGGNIIAGATSLTYVDTAVIPGTQYYYKMVYTDSIPASVTSAQLSVVTDSGNQVMNQFAQAPILGMLDLKYNYNTIAARMDDAVVGGFIAGQAVKVTQQAGEVPIVTPCTANTDVVFGFINFDIKTKSFIAGSMMEISQRGNVVFLIATAAIARGAQVMIDPATIGGIVTVSSGKPITGFCLDVASAAGQIVRIELTTPAYAVAP